MLAVRTLPDSIRDLSKTVRFPDKSFIPREQIALGRVGEVEESGARGAEQRRVDAHLQVEDVRQAIYIVREGAVVEAWMSC